MQMRIRDKEKDKVAEAKKGQWEREWSVQHNHYASTAIVHRRV